MEYKDLFTSSMKNAKSMEETTFSIEELDIEDVNMNEFMEKINFQHDKWAIASSGGSMVIAHNCDKNPEGGYKYLSVYDGKCSLINKIPLYTAENIQGLYITSEECIIIIFFNAEIQTFNLRGNLLSDFEFNVEENDFTYKIVSYSFWENGLFLVLNNNWVYVCDNFSLLNFRKYCECKKRIIGCVAVPSDVKTNCDPMLWGWGFEGEIILVQEKSFETEFFQYPVDEILFSPSLEFALIRSDTNYFFLGKNLNDVKIHIHFDEVIPKKIIWCGNDTVLLIKNNKIWMLGNSDRALYWEMKSDFAIITEIDGARIFTKEGIFLLRAFIGITFDFGSWNEECIALKLFKCMNNIDYLATNEPFNDFSIDEIEEGLIGLNDATLFFTKFKQRQSLLLAISRLHLIIPIPKDDGSEESEKLIQLRNFDQFAEQISILRICEIMNHQPFNILITYAELKALTIPNLLKRLCNRSLHFEALRIANFMGIDTSFISAHWANCLIRTKLSPREINEKLLEMKGQIDLIGLAMTAFLIQKEEIAFKLLDLCSTKSRCVPILLNQKNWNECLEYSILSEDSSLMAYTFEEVNKYDKKNLRKITSKNEISFNLMLDILK